MVVALVRFQHNDGQFPHELVPLVFVGIGAALLAVALASFVFSASWAARIHRSLQQADGIPFRGATLRKGPPNGLGGFGFVALLVGGVFWGQATATLVRGAADLTTALLIGPACIAAAFTVAALWAGLHLLTRTRRTIADIRARLARVAAPESHEAEALAPSVSRLRVVGGLCLTLSLWGAALTFLTTRILLS